MTLMMGPSRRMKTILGFTTAKFFPLCSCSSEGFALLEEQSYQFGHKTSLCPERTKAQGQVFAFSNGKNCPTDLCLLFQVRHHLCPGHFFFLLRLQTIWAIHRDLVKVLVIFMLLEDRNKNLFLLQKWTYLLCTQKLNSSA